MARVLKTAIWPVPPAVRSLLKVSRSAAVASVPLPQHVHWEHGQERLAIFLQAETQIANHNLKFDEENQECPVEVEGPE